MLEQISEYSFITIKFIKFLTFITVWMVEEITYRM